MLCPLSYGDIPFGVVGFEPTASPSRTVRATSAPYPARANFNTLAEIFLFLLCLFLGKFLRWIVDLV